MAKLDLKPIVDVDINLSLKSAARKGFNLGLIIGSSDVIPTTERVRVYTSADAMLTDGFTTESEEYEAALLYFGASTKPDRLAVGRFDNVKDETKLKALQECRAANSEWYCFVELGASEGDAKDAAMWAEAAEPSCLHMYTTHDTKVLASTTGTEAIFQYLKGKKYRRSFGQYCADTETEAVVATMGYAMGANSGVANSAFTLAYKTLVGVDTDDLTEAQVEYICGSSTTTGSNGNVYITRGEEYDILQQGYMADKTSFDEILNLDMLKNEIVLNVMDLLYQSRKISQTEAGVDLIINTINVACKKFVKNGFIAPGQWNGAPCLELKQGDYLPDGYLVQSEPIDEQSQADRDARKAPPIYVCIKLAGAIEFVTIAVNVNR